jgi:hypothetical protein
MKRDEADQPRLSSEADYLTSPSAVPAVRHLTGAVKSPYGPGR